jgi:hypothetical protein
MNKNIGLRGPHLAGYSDDFLHSLFTPTELEQVYKTGAIARSVGLNSNPSGTAAVSSTIEQTGNPLKAAKQAVAAYLTLYKQISQKAFDVCQDGPHNQIQSKPTIEAEVVESDARNQ